MKITTIDCQYMFPEFAAAYLITHGGRAVIVDNNTSHSIPLILAALKKEGISAEAVDFLIVTHVHLDHAGGSSLLMKSCPGAKLLAHPRAIRHLIDPEKLVSSARKVYGEEVFEKLYGKIEPIDASRVLAMEDDQILRWPDADGVGGLEFQFLHTRGHANHHFCISVKERGLARAVFAGDAFGLRYPALQDKGLFVFPSTSPTDFDADQARNSIKRIVAVGAPVVYPTHFGPITEIEEASVQLLSEIDFSEALLKEARVSEMSGGGLTQFCEDRVRKHFRERFSKTGRAWTPAVETLVDTDLKLNAQGIAFVAEKSRTEKKEQKI